MDYPQQSSQKTGKQNNNYLHTFGKSVCIIYYERNILILHDCMHKKLSLLEICPTPSIMVIYQAYYIKHKYRTYSRKGSPRENFNSPVFPSALMDVIFILCIFLSRVNDYTEPMATFTTWVKIYSTKYFCDARQLNCVKLLPSKNFQPYGTLHTCII